MYIHVHTHVIDIFLWTLPIAKAEENQGKKTKSKKIKGDQKEQRIIINKTTEHKKRKR